jgi:hypothetical protein
VAVIWLAVVIWVAVIWVAVIWVAVIWVVLRDVGVRGGQKLMTATTAG